MRSKENKQDCRPRQTTRLEQFPILREPASTQSPREMVAGFRGLTFCRSSSGSSWGPIWLQVGFTLGFPLHLEFLVSAERALPGRRSLSQLQRTPCSCLLGCRLGWMALGNSSQWDIPLGKGSPRISGKERHRGEATEPDTRKALGLAIKLRTDDWSASSRHLG